MKQLFENFWKKFPALYFALSFLIGASFAFTHSFFFLFSLSSFLFFRRESVLCLLVAFFGYLYTFMALPPLVAQDSSFRGSGLFHITNISFATSFQKSLLYQGEFLYFTSNDQEKSYSHLPAGILLNDPGEETRPKADHLYFLSGEIKAIHPYSFSFKPDKHQIWEKREPIFSLVEIRYRVKDILSKFLEEKIPHKPSFAFLNGLIVGTLDDRLLKFSFARLGLQHVMAISGSHFAFLISLLSFLLHRIFTKRKTLFFLLFFVQLYYLFIGPAPSIQRAYLMTLMLLVAQIFSKRNQSLNALGVSLFLAILFDPMIVQNIGFQLSFLCTGALILATPLFSEFLSPIFKKRDSQIPIFLKIPSALSSFFREALSLSLAINLWILPLLLYDFHQFPLLSLLYNLFFPLLSFVPILLLLFSLLLHLLFPFAASFGYWLTTSVTKVIIDIVLYPPSSLEMTLCLDKIPLEFLPLYWSLLLLALIYWKEKKKIEKEFLPYL
jgi:competence protein ComEC